LTLSKHSCDVRENRELGSTLSEAQHIHVESKCCYKVINNNLLLHNHAYVSQAENVCFWIANVCVCPSL